MGFNLKYFTNRITHPSEPGYATTKMWQFGLRNTSVFPDHPLPNVMRGYAQLKTDLTYPLGFVGSERARFLYEIFNNGGKFNWESYRQANLSMKLLFSWFQREIESPGTWVNTTTKKHPYYAEGFQDVQALKSMIEYSGMDLKVSTAIRNKKGDQVQREKRLAMTQQPTVTQQSTMTNNTPGFKGVTAGGLHVVSVDDWGQSGMLVVTLKEHPGPLAYHADGQIVSPVGKFTDADLRLVPDVGIKTTIGMQQVVHFKTALGTRAVGVICTLPGRAGITGADEVRIQHTSVTDAFAPDISKVLVENLRGDATLEELYLYRDTVRLKSWQKPVVTTTSIVVPVRHMANKLAQP